MDFGGKVSGESKESVGRNRKERKRLEFLGSPKKSGEEDPLDRLYRGSDGGYRTIEGRRLDQVLSVQEGVVTKGRRRRLIRSVSGGGETQNPILKTF